MLPGKKYTPADIITILLHRKWFLLVPMLIGGYAGLVVSSRLTNVYQSEMLIQIVPQRVPDTYVRSTVTMRTEDRLNALTQQVTSRTELERLITQMDLYPSERAAMPMGDVVGRMRNSIFLDVVRSQRDTRDAEAFYLRFSYPDADVATRVTERLGAMYIDVNSRDRGTLAEATNSFLESQLVQARQQLEVTERKLEEFRKRNAGRLPTQTEFNMRAIESTQVQLQSLVTSLANDRDRKQLLERLYNEAAAERVAIVAPSPAPAAGAGDPAAVVGGGAQQQLTSARENLARAELRLTPEHPDIMRLKRTIANLERRVADEEAATVAGSRSSVKPPVMATTSAEQTRRERLAEQRAQIESLDRQIRFKEMEENRLQSVIAEYQTRIEQTPGVESEWTAVTRDYQTQQDAYKDMRAKSEQSKVAAELERRQVGEQFRVLDPARRPYRPTGLPRYQVNAAGAAAGLVVGFLFAAFLEFRDTTLRTGADAQEVFELPVLALVPYMASAADRRRTWRNRLLLSLATAVVVGSAGYGFWALQLWRHIR